MTHVMLRALRAQDVPAAGRGRIRVVRERDLEGFEVSRSSKADGGGYYVSGLHFGHHVKTLTEVREMITKAE